MHGDQRDRCHGPEGAGALFAPDLTESADMDAAKFDSVVMKGRKNMMIALHDIVPSFRPDPDVWDNLAAHLRLAESKIG